MAKRKPGMTDADYTAYKERLARRAAKAKPAPQEMDVEVGIMTAHVEAGPDKVLGTADDKMTIKPTATVFDVPHEPKPDPFPEYSSKMTKADLLGVAEGVVGPLSAKFQKMTKANIIKALDAAKASK